MTKTSGEGEKTRLVGTMDSCLVARKSGWHD